MSEGIQAIAAEICRLESDLVTAWLQRLEVRQAWAMDPREFYSPHIQALAKAAVTMPVDLDENLCSRLGSAPAHRRELLQLFGTDPWFSLEYVSDVKGTLARTKSLRALLLVQEGVTKAVSGVHPGTALPKVLNELREALEAGEQITRKKAFSEQDLFGLTVDAVSRKDRPGLTTGFEALDSLTGGIRPGHVWAFGAPTNWGKSSWLLALTDRWKVVHNERVLYVTCEDSPEILANRLLSRRLGINGKDIRDNRLSVENHQLIVDEYAKATSVEMMLDGRGVDVEDLATAVRARVKGDNINLVLIDYLQCIGSRKKHQDRRNEINYIARTLTHAIKTTGAAGVLASQLTDGNLRESRDLENAAEVVIIGEQSDVSADRSLFLKKNKTGRKGMLIDAPWDDNTGSFRNVTDGETMMADDFGWDN